MKTTTNKLSRIPSADAIDAFNMHRALGLACHYGRKYKTLDVRVMRQFGVRSQKTRPTSKSSASSVNNSDGRSKCVSLWFGFQATKYRSAATRRLIYLRTSWHGGVGYQFGNEWPGAYSLVTRECDWSATNWFAKGGCIKESCNLLVDKDSGIFKGIK